MKVIVGISTEMAVMHACAFRSTDMESIGRLHTELPNVIVLAGDFIERSQRSSRVGLLYTLGSQVPTHVLKPSTQPPTALFLPTNDFQPHPDTASPMTLGILSSPVRSCVITTAIKRHGASEGFLITKSKH